MAQTPPASPLVLALDVGTSSARASLWDAAGREVPEAFVQAHYFPRTTADGGAELDTAALLEAVAGLIDTLLAGAGARAGAIAGVGFSCFWHSLVGIDAGGQPLTPLYTWADTRARAALPALRGRLDERAVHARTGCFLHPTYWPAKLAWLGAAEPDLARRVAHWLSFGDFLFLHLFGVPATALSMASATGLLDQNRRDWDADVLAALPVKGAQLPSLVDRNRPFRGLRPVFAGRWPALAGVPWFPAVGDGACSSLGCGALGPGRAALMVGTSGAMRVTWRAESVDIPWGLWCYRLDGARFVMGGALNNGGAVYAWAQRTLRLASDEAMERALGAMAPDDHGLTVLPFLYGERSPDWAPSARAALVGLTGDTTALEITRALLEAVALRFALVYQVLRRSLPEAHDLIATGRALVASPVWTQILTDTLGRLISLSPVAEASSRGAALLALEGLGLLGPLEDLPVPAGRPFRPDPDHHRTYRAALERQRRLFEALITRQQELELWA